MKRRDFIAVFGSAAALTLTSSAARAQTPALPVIGFLDTGPSKQYPDLLNAFRKGLGEFGFVEDRNVTIEYRYSDTENQPAAAAELVRHKVSVIAALGGAPAAFAAKAATSTIPVAFLVAVDPVASGLVSSLNRPGGNLTGITTLNIEVGPKRVELMHELIPAAKKLALLVNPSNPYNTEVTLRDLGAAAQKFGLDLRVVQAADEDGIVKAFVAMAEMRPDGLVIGTDGFLIIHSEKLAQLALAHRIAAIFQYRTFAAAGGLMSYGSSYAETYYQVGVYVGHLLKGESPATLPVQRSTKLELIINLKTAKSLGISVPLPLLGRADEVIE